MPAKTAVSIPVSSVAQRMAPEAEYPSCVIADQKFQESNFGWQVVCRFETVVPGQTPNTSRRYTGSCYLSVQAALDLGIVIEKRGTYVFASLAGTWSLTTNEKGYINTASLKFEEYQEQ